MRSWPGLFLILAGCGVTVPGPNDAVWSDVTFPAGKDTVAARLYHQLPQITPGPYPGVILVHGDFGPNDWVRERALRMADHGFAVLVVDLYRGEKPGDLMDAHIMGRGLPDERAVADLRAAVAYLLSRPDIRKKGVGVVGFDMGGGYALDAALADPRLKAVVTCYGRVPTGPDSLRALEAPVLGIFAEKDEGITPQTREQFRRAMEKADKRLAGLHVYEGCGHGFLDTSAPTPSGSDADRADAWSKIEKFLAVELQ